MALVTTPAKGRHTETGGPDVRARLDDAVETPAHRPRDRLAAVLLDMST
ncbi:hypothetical protein LUX12_15895 [Streptomyces somaliensis]|nr:hypothetical protein [Streptomyces somaliensis]MCP9945937.1 hypothetical protein [Streptomyces somaliensis]MCP9960890.1 hypothetical protein [Streptomyces somaliensis]